MDLRRMIAHRIEPRVVAKKKTTAAQIIGLLKSRTSGITLSRHAYADVLRTIYADLADVTTEDTSIESRLNVWAARPLNPLFLDQLGQHKRPGLNIWCFVCESNILPERSLEACENADQVWVPTEFVRDVCVAGGMPAHKVWVVPYYLPTLPPRSSDAKHAWTALVSWDGRSSVHRKNVVGAIAAFRLAWPRSQSVRLRLKTRDLHPEHRSIVVDAMQGDPRISLEEHTVETVAEIFAPADSLLHLHRAEGYGRHIVEAMQMEIPVICTDYSGPRDWCRQDNAWLVPVASMVSTAVQTEYQYPQGGTWAEPDIDAAAEALREVHSGSKRGVSARVASAARTVQRYASLDNSREAMLAALSVFTS